MSRKLGIRNYSLWYSYVKRTKPANLLVFADTGKKIHGPLKEAKLKCTISNSDRLSWYKYKQIMLTANEMYKNII